MSDKLYYLYTEDVDGNPTTRVYATGLDGAKIVADEGTKAWWENFNIHARYVHFKSEEIQAKD